ESRTGTTDDEVGSDRSAESCGGRVPRRAERVITTARAPNRAEALKITITSRLDVATQKWPSPRTFSITTYEDVWKIDVLRHWKDRECVLVPCPARTFGVGRRQTDLSRRTRSRSFWLRRRDFHR